MLIYVGSGSLSNDPLKKISNTYYSGSTESGSSNNKALHFGTGANTAIIKYNPYNARCVRAL